MVALRSSSPRDCSARLESLGAVEVETRDNGRGSTNVVAWFNTSDEVAAAIQECRHQGDRAVPGPLSPGAWMAWERHSAPFAYADRCCICFPWSIVDGEGFDEIVEIDPGHGFGAGGHPSTQLVLEELGRRPLDGRRVLDVGSGSGVLSAVAAVRGAQVTAVDIDERAIAATRDNAKLNGVENLVSASSSGLDQLDATYDLILANVHAQALTKMADDLGRLLAEDGELVLSGISSAQVASLEKVLSPLDVRASTRRDDWVAMVMSKT